MDRKRIFSMRISGQLCDKNGQIMQNINTASNIQIKVHTNNNNVISSILSDLILKNFNFYGTIEHLK